MKPTRLYALALIATGALLTLGLQATIDRADGAAAQMLPLASGPA